MRKRKLSDEEARKIRTAAAGCPTCGQSPSYSSLGKTYGISAVSIHHIVHRYTYADVD